MKCPERGLWRAWIDGEVDSQSITLSNHLAACDDCRALVDDTRQLAAHTALALAEIEPEHAITPRALVLARQQVEWRLRNAQSRPSSTVNVQSGGLMMRMMTNRWRVATIAAASVVAISLATLTEPGQVATASFLSQFRSQRLAVITVDSAIERGPFGQLERVGSIQGPGKDRFENVSTVAEAAQKVGFTLRQPDPATLPAGYDPKPNVRVTRTATWRFTFDTAKARAYFKEIGNTGMTIPDKFNGASLVVSVPSGAVLEYRRAGGGEDRLAVLQSGEISAGAEGGVALEEMREFLLRLPGLPPETVRQLRNIQDWKNTLPIPIPADRVNWQDATIAGGPGLVLNDIGGVGSAAIWQRDGRIYGVAGTVRSADVQRVANGLR